MTIEDRDLQEKLYTGIERGGDTLRVLANYANRSKKHVLRALRQLQREGRIQKVNRRWTTN